MVCPAFGRLRPGRNPRRVGKSIGVKSRIFEADSPVSERILEVLCRKLVT